MQLNYLSTDRKRDEQFLSLLALGITYALKEHVISCDDSWNWLLNIKTLNTLNAMGFNEKIKLAVHLGAELGDIQRLVPNEFDNSCNEIIGILKEMLKESFHETNEIVYLLEIKE